MLAAVCVLCLIDVRADADGVPLPPGAVARLGSARFRHPQPAHGVRFTPDGRTVLTTTAAALHVWDAATGRRRAVWPIPERGDPRPVRFVEPAADGRSAVVLQVADGRATATAVELATGRTLWQTALPHADFAVLAAGGKTATVTNGGGVTAIDTATGRPLGPPQRVEDLYATTASADGRRLVTITRGQATVTDVETGRTLSEVAVQAPDAGHMPAVAVSADGGRFLRVTSDAKGYCWLRADDAAGRRTKLRAGVGRNAPAAIGLSPDGRLAAFVGEDEGEVYVWAVDTDRELRRFVVAPPPLDPTFRSLDDAVTDLTFSPDGQALAVAFGRRVRLWDIATGRPLDHSADDTTAPDLAFVAGGRLAVVADDTRVFDAATGREVRRLPGRRDGRSATVSPDGTRLAVASAERLELLDAATGVPVRVLDYPAFDPRRYPLRVWFAADGRTLYAGRDARTGWLTPHPLGRWDAATGAARPPLPGRPLAHTWPPAADGGGFAAWTYSVGGFSPGKGTVTVWPATGDRPGREFRFFGRGEPAVGPGGRLLAVSGMPADDPRLPTDPDAWRRYVMPTGLTVWDVAAWRPRHGFVVPRPYDGLAFSPDGRTLAAAGWNGRIDLWEVSSGRVRHTFHHAGHVTRLAFAPDSATLAAASPDAPVFVWDVRGTLDRLPSRLDRPALEAHWRALAGADADAAFRAVRGLAAAPADAVPFLRDKLPPAVAPPAADVDRWLAALDAPAFADREKAAAELTRTADVIGPRLRQARAGTASAEVRQRLDAILTARDAGTPEALRAVRAVEAVTWMNTPAAVALVRAWAGGAAGAAVTEAAR